MTANLQMLRLESATAIKMELAKAKTKNWHFIIIFRLILPSGKELSTRIIMAIPMSLLEYRSLLWNFYLTGRSEEAIEACHLLCFMTSKMVQEE